MLFKNTTGVFKLSFPTIQLGDRVCVCVCVCARVHSVVSDSL